MKRLTFSESPSRDDLLGYFFDEPWTYVREHMPEEEDPKPHEIEWVAGDRGQHHITFVNDHRGGVQFFAFSTDEPDKEEVIEHKLLNSPFKVMTHAQVFEEFDAARDSDALIRAFGKIAVIAPNQFDSKFEAPVQRVLKHTDPKVRAAALGLLTYMLWPEWRSMVASLVDDAEPNVQRKARLVLDTYREFSPGKG